MISFVAALPCTTDNPQTHGHGGFLGFIEMETGRFGPGDSRLLDEAFLYRSFPTSVLRSVTEVPTLPGFCLEY